MKGEPLLLLSEVPVHLLDALDRRVAFYEDRLARLEVLSAKLYNARTLARASDREIWERWNQKAQIYRDILDRIELRVLQVLGLKLDGVRSICTTIGGVEGLLYPKPLAPRSWTAQFQFGIRARMMVVEHPGEEDMVGTEKRFCMN